MKEPFQEIASAFREKTGCEVNVISLTLLRSRHRSMSPGKAICLSPDLRRSWSLSVTK